MIPLISVLVAGSVLFGFPLSTRTRFHQATNSFMNARNNSAKSVLTTNAAEHPLGEMNTTQVSKILDQLRMCLAAGLTVPVALHEVAMMNEADPAMTWLDSEMSRNPIAALRMAREYESPFSTPAHLLERSFVSGAPLHSALGTLNEQLHKAVTQEVTRKVRAVSVKAVLPLGVCFLPAFILLTVVPISVGLFQQMSW
jgi:pilus assembly protein TadC